VRNGVNQSLAPLWYFHDGSGPMLVIVGSTAFIAVTTARNVELGRKIVLVVVGAASRRATGTAIVISQACRPCANGPAQLGSTLGKCHAMLRGIQAQDEC